MEIEVVVRWAWETGEGIDGAGGQGAQAAALSNATAVSHPGCAEPPDLGQDGYSGVPLQTRLATVLRMGLMIWRPLGRPPWRWSRPALALPSL